MIYKILIFSILTLLVLGCDRRKPPEDTFTQIINDDSVYDKTPIYNEGTSYCPDDIPKFQDVLDHSKYQYPDNNTTVDYNDFNGYKTKNFYVNEDNDFYFVLSKVKDSTKVRNELREGPQSREWQTSDSNEHSWVTKVRCFKPKVGITSYTWMQIHGTNDTFDYPILRLLWVRSRNGIYDHIWSIVIISNPGDAKIYEWTDLGKRPNDFFDAAVYVQNNTMKININNNTIRTYDVSYWKDVSNYFKAGVYLNIFQDGGDAVVAYRELQF